ncbi:MAG: exodeoxyribonuclease VII small subunit [Candidatus Hydrogenedentes bacterium]|nr:exodeoxyribonuclease VII small subunit [Candidatus Hydrogenedentota bacterium]
MAEPKFEKDLERLESIVEALEEGGLSLDESLKRFEEGIKLAQRCEKALTEAEKKIEILTKTAEGRIEAKPFGEESEGNSGEETDSNESPAKEKGEEGELLF